jgi:hypothetical protein
MAKFVKIDQATFDRLQGRAEKAALPYATEVHFDRRSHEVKLILNTGIKVAFDPRLAHGLEEASELDLADVEIEGAGGSIYFPKLDADFSVSRLLEGFLGPLEWARRERQAEASRENGKLGGRPRKHPARVAA